MPSPASKGPNAEMYQEKLAQFQFKQYIKIIII